MEPTGGDEAEERAFDRRMSRFLGRRGRAASKTSNLNMVDYRLTNDLQRGEQGECRPSHVHATLPTKRSLGTVQTLSFAVA